MIKREEISSYDLARWIEEGLEACSYQSAWIDTEDLDYACLDGRFNLVQLSALILKRMDEFE